MMFLGALMLCGVSEFMGQVAPAQAMLYLVLYVWSRRNPTQQVSLYGFPVQAVMLPWALCAFNMVIGNSLVITIDGHWRGPPLLARSRSCRTRTAWMW